MTNAPWRIAGLLFAIGGLLSAVGAVIFASDPSVVGSITTLVGLVLEGAAFILFGRGLSGARVPTWMPWLFFVAGGLDILLAALAVAGVNVGSAGLVIVLLITALILVGSLMLLSVRVTGRPLSWALVILAIVLLANVLTGSPATLVLVGAVYVLIGFLLMRNPRRKA